MIITKQKPFDIIERYIAKDRFLFLIGCEDCAAQCQTGGEKEIEEARKALVESGKEVLGTEIGPSLCHELNTKRILRKQKEILTKSDRVLVFACGAGVQAVSEAITCPVSPGCDSLFLGNIARHLQFTQKCSLCGECTLNRYGGVCATTRCSKGLMNGPCGGSVRGKCEVDATVDCAWIKIYEKMMSQGRIDELTEMCPPRDYRDGCHYGT